MKRRPKSRPEPISSEELLRQYNLQSKINDASPGERRRYYESVGIVISTNETKALAEKLATSALGEKALLPRDVRELVVAFRIGGFVSEDIQAGLASAGYHVSLDDIDAALLHHGHYRGGNYYFTTRHDLRIAAQPGWTSSLDTWTRGFWMAYGDPEAVDSGAA